MTNVINKQGKSVILINTQIVNNLLKTPYQEAGGTKPKEYGIL